MKRCISILVGWTIFLRNENEKWGVKKVLNQNLNQKSKSFVVWTYANIEKMLNVVIEVECVIKNSGDSPYEYLKEEQ